MKRSLASAIALPAVVGVALPVIATSGAQAAVPEPVSAGTLVLSARPGELRDPRVIPSPKVVKLYPTGKSSVELLVDFGSTCVDDGHVQIVHAEGTKKGFQSRYQLGQSTQDFIRVSFRFNAHAAPGRWYVDLAALLCEEPMFMRADKVASFWVKRSTKVTGFDARPEPIRRGGALKLTGYLKRLEPKASGGPAHIGFKGATVRVEFSEAGSGGWTTVGTAKTGPSGFISKTFRATKDGNWRFVYGGSPYYAPSSAAPDYVDVR